MQRIEEEDEGDEADAGEEGEVSESVWHKVNEDVTLSQADLCAIYSCLHWASESQGTRWNDVELKQILGHALLRLDDDKYHQLDLKDVITRLCDERDDLTKKVKLHAERHRENWVVWIPKLKGRYLEMCAKDKKLAKQRDDELAAQQAIQAAADIIRPEKRRRTQDPEHEMSHSITSELAESSSRSQDSQGRAEKK